MTHEIRWRHCAAGLLGAGAVVLFVAACAGAGAGGGGGGGSGDGGGGGGGGSVYLSSPVEHVVKQDLEGVSHVTVADIDADGSDDLLVAAHGSDGRVLLFLNDGTGTFTEETIDADYDFPDQVMAADLDEDGDLDILVTGSEAITWYRNDNSGGTFDPTEFVEDPIQSGANPITSPRIAVANVDGSSGIDIIAAHPRLFLNDGSESFTFIEVDFVDPTNGSWMDIAVADLDGDTDLDLVNVYYDSDTLTWIEGQGTSSFDSDPADSSVNTFEHLIDDEAAKTPNSRIVAVDLDQDGDVDVVGSADDIGLSDDAIYWYDNQGGATSFVRKPVSGSRRTADDLVVDDLDADGDFDIIVADEDNQEILIWINDGAESFSELVIASGSDATYPESVAVGDFDGDGDKDIVYVNDSDSPYVDDVVWYEVLTD